MYCKITWLMTAVMLGLTLPGGQGEAEPLTGKAGDDITLQTGVTGLHDDYQIIWSNCEDQHQPVLVNFDDGVLKRKTSERFHLDINTGSLTIRSLSINDTGLYQGQIINGNVSWHNFNLTVVEADPIKPTAGPPDNITAHQQKHLVVVLVCLAVAVAVAVCIIYAVRCNKIKGKRWGNSAAI